MGLFSFVASIGWESWGAAHPSHIFLFVEPNVKLSRFSLPGIEANNQPNEMNFALLVG